MYEIRITFGESVDNKRLDTIKRKASQTFGGYTLLDATGGWYSSGEIVEENSRVLVVRGTREDIQDDVTIPEGTTLEEWTKASARFLKRRSDEDAIMWDIREVHTGGMV
jgi:hypothetical protein